MKPGVHHAEIPIVNYHFRRLMSITFCGRGAFEVISVIRRIR